jgi:Zn-dependent peptidase ImmA (M78 family)
MAVIGQSQHRQAWYREYALGLGAETLGFVGSAAGMDARDAAARIRTALAYEVHERRGSWNDARKTLIRAFEAIGGLTVVTSMVGHNTHRLLDEHEFRGFTLVDEIAPLVFVNAHQTLNGQIFTLAHEFAHVWRGASGVGNEEPRSMGRSSVERWCNEVASEVLVPSEVLAERHHAVSGLPITDALDALSRDFRCGTPVVLQALNRAGIRRFDDFQSVYDDEVARLSRISASQPGGGMFYNNLPFRVGDRLSRALVADVEEGGTAVEEAMRLMSVGSLSVFDKYARELGVA